MLDIDVVVDRFEKAAKAVYPASGWQRPLARDFSISQSQISKWVNRRVALTEDSRNLLTRILTELEQTETRLKHELALTLASVIEANVEPDTLRGKIVERFEMIDDLVRGVVDGNVRSVMVFGPQGLGKSYSALNILRKSGKPFVTVTGKVTPIGLYQFLYENRTGIVLFDDCDSVLATEGHLNQLKAATNTDDSYRRLSWKTQSSVVYSGSEEQRDEEVASLKAEIADVSGREEINEKRLDTLRDKLERLEKLIPREFDFEGGIIFITNLDIWQMIEDHCPVEEHLRALVDRGFLMPLGLNTAEAKMERVAQGVEDFGILDKYNVDRSVEGKEIVDFMRENVEKLQSISFRTAEKIANLYKTSPRWKRITAVTMFRYSV